MEVQRRTWVEQLMGMPVSVLARGDGARDSQAHSAVSDLFAELRQVDDTFSTYRETSEVSRISRGELSVETASAEIQEVARKCHEAKVLTHGLFDAQRPDGVWDPSGLVKGWAVERAFRILLAIDHLDWCLNAGGDVMLASRSGASFNVGIQDPMDAAHLATVISLSDGAVATSGTAARGEHLYDPRNGGSATASRSVSVSGPSLEVADIFATATFVAGLAGLDLIENLDGYEAMRIDSTGCVTNTSGWSALLTTDESR